MKKIIPILAVLMALCACDRFKSGTYQDEMVMPLEGSQEDSLFYKLSLQYVSSGMLIPAMEKINQAIVSQAFDLEAGSGTLEESASQYRENLIDEYIAENSGMVGQMPVLTWEDFITGEFTYKYKGWRNYQINYYCYRGGAHGYSTCTQMVFDAKTGELLTQEALFADGFQEPVALLMRERVKSNLETENADILEFLDLGDIVPNGNFSVGPDGVEWLFQPDSILPHAFGLLTVKLSWDELKPYLR